MKKLHLGVLALAVFGLLSLSLVFNGNKVFAVGEVAVDNSNLVWSPYGWVSNGSTYRQSPTVGSYVNIAFTGTTLGLNVDIGMLGGPVVPSNISISAYIDNDAPISMTLGDVVSNQLIFTNSLSNAAHYASIVIDSNKNYSSRWSYSGGGPLSLLRITSIQLSTLGTASSLFNTPLEKTNTKIIYYGDSITEGNGIGGGAYGSRSTATNVGEMLNVSYGIHGYSQLTWWSSIFSNTTDFTYPVSDSVNFPSAVWNNNYHNESLLNTPSLANSGYREGVPDAVFNNLGIDDINLYDFFGNTALSNFSANITDWLNQTRSTLGARPAIFMVAPFNYSCISIINPIYNSTQELTLQLYKQTYVDTINDYKNASSDNRVFIVDLGESGCQTVVENSTDNLHPNETGAHLLAENIVGSSRQNIILDTPLTVTVNGQNISNKIITTSLVKLTGTAPGSSTITVSAEPDSHLCTTLVAVDGTWSCNLETLTKNVEYLVSVSAATTYGQILSLDNFKIIYTDTFPLPTILNGTLAATGNNVNEIFSLSILLVLFSLLRVSARKIFALFYF